MRVDAHLEESCEDEKTHAEPCDWFEAFLHRFDKNKLCFWIERALHGRQNKERNPCEAANPGDSSKQMKPECECQRPRGRGGDHGVVATAGGSVGAGSVVAAVVGGGSVVTAGVSAVTIGVNNCVRSMVAVGG